MAGFFFILQHVRLKILVTFARFMTTILSPFPKPQFDAILLIPSRDKSHAIRVHVYGPSDDGALDRPRPVLMNFNGSGFAMHFHGRDDYFCRQVATVSGHLVLDVQYRVGPEHPFPTAVNDMEDAVKFVLGRPGKYQKSHISLSGFSSGGTLALVAPLLFPRGTFRSIGAFYPATDLATDPDLRRAPAANAKPRPTYWTKVFRQAYVGQMDARDPRISPAYADTANYPSDMLVVTGELDSSAIEAETLAEKIKNEDLAGQTHVDIRRMAGCGHDFDKKKGETETRARDEVYGLLINMLKRISS